MSTFDKVSRYHQSSKHGYHSFAPGPGNLDWYSQPDPFRRYEGAEVIPLKQIPPSEKPFFSEALQPSTIAASPLSFESISQLFFDSLALSAWKSFQGSTWALRVNPSSGNLHPTEGYLISGPLQGLSEVPFVSHYAPKLHGLEVRATFPIEIWTTLLAGLPDDTIFIGLSSIYWREAWKYGLRAFRYCHHDLGHALAAINIACAGMGWRAVLMDQMGCDDLEIILGLTEKNEEEVEVPDCLMAISPNEISSDWNFDKQQLLDSFTNANWCGTPNILSKSHVAWPGIDEVSQNTKKPFTEGQPNFNFNTGSLSKLLDADSFPLRKAIHQRRSAVAMDGRTKINRETFYQFLIKTIPEACPLPFQTLPWEPNVHLGLFVHRVDDLPRGLYFLLRNKSHLQDLKTKFKDDFLWEKPEGCPAELDLFLLDQVDTMRTAASVSCGQEIAANGCFSLGMISAFEAPLKKYGSWFYPRLYWECGAIGHVFYLQAEVSGIRSTGIGCFFDDPVHQIFGIQDMSYQSLYHFTVGGPVEDTRLTTLPAY
jgi:SagB-type dehydrogenase family enzyme